MRTDSRMLSISFALPLIFLPGRPSRPTGPPSPSARTAAVAATAPATTVEETTNKQSCIVLCCDVTWCDVLCCGDMCDDLSEMTQMCSFVQHKNQEGELYVKVDSLSGTQATH